jgi:small subunit ribosomal protein S9
MSNEILTIGKRKTAVARAVTRKGNGKVLINGKPVELYPIELLRNKLMEPLKILGDMANVVYIEI